MTRRTFKNPKAKSGILFLLGIFFLGGILVFKAHPALAQGSPDLGLTYATATGLTSSDIRVVVARIIEVFLGLLGVVAVGIVIYAGYLWMTSQGNEETITKARQLIVNAVIGLAIILSAYAIVAFVISKLLIATTGGEETGGLPGGNGFIGTGVGSSNLESHYPPRDATGVPRNTKIIVTFKVPITPSTILDTSDAAWVTANCQGIPAGAMCGKLATGGSPSRPNVDVYPTAAPGLFLAADKIRVITVDDTPAARIRAMMATNRWATTLSPQPSGGRPRSPRCGRSAAPSARPSRWGV